MNELKNNDEVIVNIVTDEDSSSIGIDFRESSTSTLDTPSSSAVYRKVPSNSVTCCEVLRYGWDDRKAQREDRCNRAKPCCMENLFVVFSCAIVFICFFLAVVLFPWILGNIATGGSYLQDGNRQNCWSELNFFGFSGCRDEYGIGLGIEIMLVLLVLSIVLISKSFCCYITSIASDDTAKNAVRDDIEARRSTFLNCGISWGVVFWIIFSIFIGCTAGFDLAYNNFTYTTQGEQIPCATIISKIDNIRFRCSIARTYCDQCFSKGFAAIGIPTFFLPLVIYLCVRFFICLPNFIKEKREIYNTWKSSAREQKLEEQMT